MTKYPLTILIGLIFVTSVLSLEVTMTDLENYWESPETVWKVCSEVASASSGQLKFPCEVADPGPMPDSVHKLRPGHISVIGAMGDSVTAGFAIDRTNELSSFTNCHGLSWDVGGQLTYEQGSTTVPNILKHYNPSLTGFSTGSADVEAAAAHLNVAVGGKQSNDIPRQARELVTRMKSMDGLDFDGDWKLLSLFIGINDLRKACHVEEDHSADSYVRNIEVALDYLQREVPRAFVNVVPVYDVAYQYGLNTACLANGWMMCPYSLDKRWQTATPQLAHQYSQQLSELIASGRYNTRQDFTVVYQPFMSDLQLPIKADGSTDYSFFVPDCVHLSYMGHNTAGVWLWNAMFEPVGKKPTSSEFDPNLYCPKHDEYFATWNNSEIDQPFQDEWEF